MDESTGPDGHDGRDQRYPLDERDADAPPWSLAGWRRMVNHEASDSGLRDL